MTNKHELIPRDWQVSDYCAKLGWYLVTIPAGSKGPTRFGWQQPEKALSDPDAARLYYEQNPNHNVGLLHGPAALVLLILITSNTQRLSLKSWASTSLS